jgi:phage FluMu protein Com
MALPKLVSAKHTMKIPSTGQTVEYRPYLVKEEKVLMMAFETKDQSQMVRALRDTVAACTEGQVDVDKLALFDLEYVFLKLRAKSVGETSKLKIKCSDCSTSNEVSVDLNTVAVQGEVKQNAKVQLTDEVGVVLKYPTVKGSYKNTSKAKDDTSQAFAQIAASIESIYDAENVYAAADESPESLNDFIESLTSDQFKKITEFFDDMPKLKHDIEFDCSNCKTHNKITIEGLTNFF